MTNKKHSRTLRLDSSYSVTTWRVLTGWAWRLDREHDETSSDTESTEHDH